jgi:phosphoribosylglycinamide formyltransferase-1
MKKIAVFVSGGGTNLQAIIDAIKSGYIKEGYIEIVVSNKKDAYGLERAVKSGIKAMFFDPKEYPEREVYDEYLAGKMNSLNIDLICLAGYMRILTGVFIDKFKGKIMNIHPALLPSFGGPGMYGLKVHEAVLNYGVKVTGCTVHFVDKNVDSGPIIIQKCVEVDENDTPETLQKRVLQLEHKAYPEAVKLFTEDKLIIEGRKVKILK